MTDTQKYILEREFQVTSADADFSYKLTVSSLVNMFIQIAWQHAEELGFGVDYLHNNNLAWVLSRFHLQIEKLPVWNDTIRLVTWPKGIRRLFYLRDLEVYDKNNQLLARATSEWLLIDIKSKRPKLEGPDEAIFNENKNKHAINTEIENLTEPETISETFRFHSCYSDIDLNQHLTTTRYIDWMFDTFNLNFHKINSCNEIILNFMREISCGEEMIVNRLKTSEENDYFFSFLGAKNEQLHLKGLIKF